MKKRIMIILLIFINAFIICLIALFNNYYNNINNFYNKSLKSMSENNNIINYNKEKIYKLEEEKNFNLKREENISNYINILENNLKKYE